MGLSEVTSEETSTGTATAAAAAGPLWETGRHDDDDGPALRRTPPHGRCPVSIAAHAVSLLHYDGDADHTAVSYVIQTK